MIMSLIEKSITVNAPVKTVYNQWTQFEEFPKFMEGVVSVQQLDDKHMRWHTNIGGTDKEFVTEITEQIPDARIAWCTRSGERHAGVVTFHRLNDHQTRVMLQMEYEPAGAVEKLGDMVGIFSRRVEQDLERFKEFIERHGAETGAWRGEINRPE
jgi:uncharacterized membrane protein